MQTQRCDQLQICFFPSLIFLPFSFQHDTLNVGPCTFCCLVLEGHIKLGCLTFNDDKKIKRFRCCQPYLSINFHPFKVLASIGYLLPKSIISRGLKICDFSTLIVPSAFISYQGTSKRSSQYLSIGLVNESIFLF